ncbi:hypothetical protein BaRGS_00010807 [Batillaria attramentaria]|uniref:Uncharacterized protein n=1 Tax=Batillaria attramentaria TaxID=370345 RepID=A0ABD0LEP1_9CAEN
MESADNNSQFKGFAYITQKTPQKAVATCRAGGQEVPNYRTLMLIGLTITVKRITIITDSHSLWAEGSWDSMTEHETGDRTACRTDVEWWPLHADGRSRKEGELSMCATQLLTNGSRGRPDSLPCC